LLGNCQQVAETAGVIFEGFSQGSLGLVIPGGGHLNERRVKKIGLCSLL
jgi:hypothetical protein